MVEIYLRASVFRGVVSILAMIGRGPLVIDGQHLLESFCYVFANIQSSLGWSHDLKFMIVAIRVLDCSSFSNFEIAIGGYKSRIILLIHFFDIYTWN